MAFKSKMLKNITKKYENGTLEIRWSPKFANNFNEVFKDNGNLQAELTTTVMNGLTIYVPYDTGNMLDYALRHTNIENGEIIFKGTYVLPQYQGYIKTKNGIVEFKNYSNQTGFRGGKWFDRYIEDNEQELVDLMNRKVKELLKRGE